MIKTRLNNWSFFMSENVKITFTGYVFSGEELIPNAKSFYENLILAHKIEDLFIKKIFSEIISSGKFSCIIEVDDKIYVITDIIRSQPLHIVQSGNQLKVVDLLTKDEQSSLDEDMVNIFVSAGNTYRSDNCYKHVYSLQAAEIVIIKGQELSSSRYFNYLPKRKILQKEEGKLIKNFDTQIQSTITRMVDSAPNVNNWIIPLSGGHDSRMLINYLKKAGANNVICFSYGSKNNIQSQISEQVAKEVGYDWYFVEYTDEKWEELYKLNILDEFIDYSFQGVSTPHVQDFLAIYELKTKGIIRKGDIIVPGHSGITGKGYTEDTEKLKSREEGILYCYNQCLKKNISDYKLVPDLFKFYFEDLSIQPCDFYAFLNWQERQTKFIVNSIRVYEFFGFESRLPFWDKTFVEFWLSLSSFHRKRKKLMHLAEKNGSLLKELKVIPFAKVKQKNRRKILTERIKKIIPAFLTIPLLRISGKRKPIAEGLNKVHAKRGSTVKDILWPVDDFPRETYKLLKPMMGRYPFQINVHYLSRLIAIRRTYDQRRTEERT